MGSIGFLVDFEFYIVVLGVARGPIGLPPPWRFKTLDSQPDKSNMVPFSIDVHDLCIFRKVTTSLWPDISCVVGLELPEIDFRALSVGTQRMRGKKLCRFEVVSTREVPYLTFSCPFTIFNFRAFLQAPPLCLSQCRESSVH